jgi:hypothetical protein
LKANSTNTLEYAQQRYKSIVSNIDSISSRIETKSGRERMLLKMKAGILEDAGIPRSNSLIVQRPEAEQISHPVVIDVEEYNVALRKTE